MLQIAKSTQRKCFKIGNKNYAEWLPIRIFETEPKPEFIDRVWRLILSLRIEHLKDDFEEEIIPG